MSILGKLVQMITGKPDYDQIADDLFNGKTKKRVVKENQKTDKIIKATLQNPNIKSLMVKVPINEVQIRDLYRRISMNVSKKKAIKAINNAELLEWFYFNGGKDMKLNFDQMIQLTLMAKRETTNI
jgi:hypothetical protein